MTKLTIGSTPSYIVITHHIQALDLRWEEAPTWKPLERTKPKMNERSLIMKSEDLSKHIDMSPTTPILSSDSA